MPYSEWPVASPQEHPTLFVSTRKFLGGHIIIERREGGLVTINIEEARRLIVVLKEAIADLELVHHHEHR